MHICDLTNLETFSGEKNKLKFMIAEILKTIKAPFFEGIDQLKFFCNCFFLKSCKKDINCFINLSTCNIDAEFVCNLKLYLDKNCVTEKTKLFYLETTYFLRCRVQRIISKTLWFLRILKFNIYWNLIMEEAPMNIVTL